MILNRIQAIWKKNWKAITFLICIWLFSSLVLKLTERPPLPRYQREVEYSTQNLHIVRNYPELDIEIESAITVDNQGILFASGDQYLTSFDTGIGRFQWQTKLEGSWNYWLTYTETSLLGTATLGINAYSVSTGEWKWSTELGTGHVSIIPQLDNNVLRVYYCDQIFELDTISGAILNQRPRSDLEWIQGEVEIYRVSDKYIRGKDRTTGKELWQIEANDFLVMETSPAGSLNNHTIFIKFQNDICLLNIVKGDYQWCRPYDIVSNFGVTSDGKDGYVLVEDFVLEKIELSTGKVLGETQFVPGTSLKPGDIQTLPESFITVTSNGSVILLFGDSYQLLVLTSD